MWEPRKTKKVEKKNSIICVLKKDQISEKHFSAPFFGLQNKIGNTQIID
jgi:hypothetical protein